MSRKLFAVLLGLVPTALPLACGSLNKGEIVIVDEMAGGVSLGGSTSGSAGHGGTVAGGRGGTGGTSGDAGEAGIGISGKGGTTGQGGTTGKGGSTSKGGTTGKGGTGTSGDAGTGGGGGEPPTDCTENSDCVSSAPICDGGSCRGCEVGHMPDECADDPNKPYCDGSSGRCVACLTSDDCSMSRPVCDAGVCRGCELGEECDSGACNSGRCADETSVVYALATTGSNDPNCGTKTLPCLNVGDAVMKMTSARPFLVLLATPEMFDYTNVTLPPMIDISIFGNGVLVGGYNAPVFTKNGGHLLLDGVIAIAAQSGTVTTSFATVELSNVSLEMIASKVSNAYDNYGSVGLKLTDSTADIQQSEFVSSTLAILSQSSAPIPTQGLTIERCLFQNNHEAVHVSADHFVIRNNLFIANGNKSYVRIIQPDAQNTSIFAYNTLYRNDNNCSYEGGLVACNGTGTCGIHSSNLFWGNMYNGSGGQPCYDQVYGYPTTISYTLSEVPYAGTGNIGAEDPLLEDASGGLYTPLSGSPAIDAGDTNPAVVPAVDYYGHPRALGNGPDIGAIEAE